LSASMRSLNASDIVKSGKALIAICHVAVWRVNYAACFLFRGTFSMNTIQGACCPRGLAKCVR
jgi:hypothetical protein